VFGRRKRQEEAAAEAAREAERRVLFAKLAERPENICPFLGLAGDRAGYVEGVSDDHRCYAFGDPAPLSAEQQTRVCQERGYGNCPRYLRGVLVIPTEELEALRRPRAPLPEPAPTPTPAAPPERRRRRALPVALLLILLVVLGGGAAGYLFLGGGLGNGLIARDSGTPSPTPVLTAEPTPVLTAEPTPTGTPEPTPTPPNGSALATPTPEPTPSAGDEFAFYEVSVGPEGYTLFRINRSGEVVNTREASFDGFSFARVAPRRGADEPVFWRTAVGGLEGWSYLHPDSGNFRIRAVFLNDQGERRSAYLREGQLTQFPEATPAP
jgi:hypothetical protein